MLVSFPEDGPPTVVMSVGIEPTFPLPETLSVQTRVDFIQKVYLTRNTYSVVKEEVEGQEGIEPSIVCAH